MTAVSVQTGRCVWVLYRFWNAHGILLYIGQTRQVANARRQQHAVSKWWAPLATTWAVDATPYYSQIAIDRAEREAIWAERPKCNEKHNGGNSDRWYSMADVPAEMRPAGVPFELQGKQPARARTSTAQVRSHFWTELRVWLALLPVAWSGLFVALWWVGGSARAAAVITVVAFGIAVDRTAPKRRRRCRR